MGRRSLNAWPLRVHAIRAGAAVILSAVVLLLPVSPGLALADERTDAATVFCMNPARQDELVSAAVTLGLGDRGPAPGRLLAGQRELDIPAWREQRRTDFERACLALFTGAQQAPAAAPAANWFTPWIPLGGVIVGAVLTLLATTWRDKIVRGRVQADALTTSVGEFIRSGEAYLDGWLGSGARPDDRPVQDERIRVFDRLAPIKVVHPRWAVVEQVSNPLTSGPLDSSLTGGWVSLDADGRAARVRTVKRDLDVLRHNGNRLAYALCRPIRSSWFWRAMKSGRKP